MIFADLAHCPVVEPSDAMPFIIVSSLGITPVLAAEYGYIESKKLRGPIFRNRTADEPSLLQMPM